MCTPKDIGRIQLGPYEVDCWYSAPYPDGYEQKKLYLCQHCLKYYRSPQAMAKCCGGGFSPGPPVGQEAPALPEKEAARQRYGPPGRQVYSDLAQGIRAYEVDGALHKTYAQCLCLLTKLFLDHADIAYSVEPYLFYVFTETTPEHGEQLLGHFSKDKAQTYGTNLSCILTLPPYQRRGLGQLFVSLSYELSRRDGYAGTPERPLSDLGERCYRRFWGDTLLSLLWAELQLNRQHAPQPQRHKTKKKKGKGGRGAGAPRYSTIAQMSAATYIAESDVTATLAALNLLHFGAAEGLQKVDPDMAEQLVPGLYITTVAAPQAAAAAAAAAQASAPSNNGASRGGRKLRLDRRAVRYTPPSQRTAASEAEEARGSDAEENEAALDAAARAECAAQEAAGGAVDGSVSAAMAARCARLRQRRLSAGAAGTDGQEHDNDDVSRARACGYREVLVTAATIRAALAGAQIKVGGTVPAESVQAALCEYFDDLSTNSAEEEPLDSAAFGARHAPLELLEQSDKVEKGEKEAEGVTDHAQPGAGVSNDTSEEEAAAAAAAAAEEEEGESGGEEAVLEVRVQGGQVVQVERELWECIRSIRAQSGSVLSSKKVFQKVQRMGWSKVNRKVINALWELECPGA
jgi:GNAT superfamily N-acetyltransferase